MARPTVHDVARVAGLSVASVSRVLTGARQVSPDVQSRVEAAARSLGYVPNRAGQALRSGKTGLVGVVMPDMAGPFFPSMIEAITQELDRAGLAGIVMGTQENVSTDRRHVETLLEWQVDALIISPVSRAGSLSTIEQAAKEVGLVQVHRWSSETICRVLPDAVDGMRQLRAHLRGQGRLRPCFVGPMLASSAAGDRRSAFASVFPRAPILETEGFGLEAGLRAVASAMELLTEVDTFVCASDMTAIGLLRGLAQQGVSLPGDVAVAGYDGTATAALVQPALTSIDPDAATLAETAVAQLAAPHRPGSTILTPVTLRVRDSTWAAGA